MPERKNVFGYYFGFLKSKVFGVLIKELIGIFYLKA